MEESKEYKVGQLTGIYTLADSALRAVGYQPGILSFMLICNQCKKTIKLAIKVEEGKPQFGIDFYAVQIAHQLKCDCFPVYKIHRKKSNPLILKETDKKKGN